MTSPVTTTIDVRAKLSHYIVLNIKIKLIHFPGGAFVKGLCPWSVQWRCMMYIFPLYKNSSWEKQLKLQCKPNLSNNKSQTKKIGSLRPAEVFDYCDRISDLYSIHVNFPCAVERVEALKWNVCKWQSRFVAGLGLRCHRKYPKSN